MGDDDFDPFFDFNDPLYWFLGSVMIGFVGLLLLIVLLYR